MPFSPEEILDQVRHNPKLIIADDYELSLQHCRSETVRYRNGEESNHGFEEQTWIGMRLLHRKRPGRSATFFRDPESLLMLVDDAFESAKSASPDPWFRFPIWKQPKEATRRAVDEWSAESLYPQVQAPPEIIDEVYEHWTIRTVLQRKSEKFQLTNEKRVQALHFSLFSRLDDFAWRRSEDRAFSRPITEREEWLGQLLNEANRFRRSPRKEMSSREVPVILSPVVVSALLKRMASWFAADSVQHGRSPVGGFKGKTVFSEALTLFDDGTFAGGVQSAPFDMEGSPTQRTALISRGSVNDFLYDTYSATRENRLSTGNLMRFPQRATPGILPTNLFFAPGDTGPKELLGMVEEGVLFNSIDSLEAVPGSETRVVMIGDGWGLARGEISSPVCQLRAEVDLMELMRRAVTVGNDLNFYGGFGSPSILFEKFPLNR